VSTQQIRPLVTKPLFNRSDPTLLKIEISGLLFDNDGVLVDSHEAAETAWAQWGSEYKPGFQLTPSWHGRRAHDIVLELVGPAKFEVANDRINQLEQDSAGLTVALHGSVELTTSLKPGVWTVVTSANPNLARARLEAAGIPVPAELVTAYDVERGKPFGDPYLLGAKRLGLGIEQCVVFEDAEAGVAAAVDAGAGFIVGVSAKAMNTPANLVVRDLSGITFENGILYIPDENRLR